MTVVPMFFYLFFGCLSLSNKVDCQSYSINTNPLSFWDSGSEANTGVYFSLSNTGGSALTQTVSYHISSQDPGTLFNGYQFNLSVENQNTTAGTLAVFVSSTQPSQDALQFYGDTLEVSENINGLGELLGKISLNSNDYKYTILQSPATQFTSDMYITLIVSEDSILEGSLNIDKLYCSKNSSYASNETSSLLSVDEIW
jgi:hypothetical protein